MDAGRIRSADRSGHQYARAGIADYWLREPARGGDRGVSWARSVAAIAVRLALWPHRALGPRGCDLSPLATPRSRVRVKSLLP